MKLLLNICIGLLCIFPNFVNAQGSGNSLDFDGTDDYLELTDIINNGDFTIEFWFTPTNATWSAALFDLTEIGGSGSGRKYFFIDGRQNRLRFHFESANDADIQITTGYTFTPGTWYHVACVGGFNRTDNHRLYINGVLEGTDGTNTNGKPGDFPPNIRIGDNQSTYLVETGAFPGQIDEVRIWSDERSLPEIRDNMCRRLVGTESNLDLLYRLDQTGSGTATDNSGKGNDGTLINMNSATDWVLSGAPIGNTSTYVYTGAWGGQTITHTSPEGDSFEVSAVSGTPEGYHIYHVNQTPNTLAGTNGVGSNDHYYGVFKTGDAGSTYTGTYFYANNDAFQNSDPSINETQLAMYKRDNNADPTWVDAGGTVDPVANTITATGESTEYILGILGASPLPIELLSFTGELKEDQVDLSWITASEINNDYFSIERSLDGSNFEVIGTVDGAGNSNQTLHYDFVDQNPYTGMNYYRLKQTDFDGDFTYSNVVSIQKIATPGNINIYPNPLKDGVLNIEFKGYQNIRKIDIVDSAGKTVYSNEGPFQMSEQLSIDNIILDKSGAYMIRLHQGDHVIVKKVVKTK